MNLLIKHRIRLLELKAEEDRLHDAVGPSAIEMTLRHPGRAQLEAAITALNRASFGCREISPSDEMFEEG
jgi:hypothetical protein